VSHYRIVCQDCGFVIEAYVADDVDDQAAIDALCDDHERKAHSPERTHHVVAEP
jgi:transcription initiation factor TFIIIB Brf1 subunit/transcription initiation factor TFIIB